MADRTINLFGPAGGVPALYHDNGDGTYSMVTSGGATDTGAASATLLAGTNALTTTAEALAASAAVREVLMQADPTNVVNVLIGNATEQPLVLAAGASLSLEVSDISLIYVKAASGTASVNYLARV